MCTKYDSVTPALQNYRFCRQSGNDAYIRGGWWGLGVIIYVIMTHCLGKSISVSPLREMKKRI